MRVIVLRGVSWRGALLDRRVPGIIVKLNRGEAGGCGAGGLNEDR